MRLPPEDEDEASRGPHHHRDGDSDRRLAGTLPATLELILGNQIYIAKEGLPPGLRNRLLRLAAFQNPEFYKAQAMRLSTLRQAASHRLRRGPPAAHRAATRLSG